MLVLTSPKVQHGREGQRQSNYFDSFIHCEMPTIPFKYFISTQINQMQ